MSNLLSDVQVKLVTSREQPRRCQRNLRSHQQAADREAQHLIRRADGCPCRGLLSRCREHGKSDGLRQMASHAAVRYHPATAARSQHDAVGLSHHRQCSACACRLPRTQKPSGKHRSNPGAIDGGNPLSCRRKVVARGSARLPPQITRLTRTLPFVLALLCLLQHVPTAINRDSQDTPEVRA